MPQSHPWAGPLGDADLLVAVLNAGIRVLGMTLGLWGVQGTSAGSGPAAPHHPPGREERDGCGNEAGAAARSKLRLPGAEEWPRAEEGALELNFLSLPWGWDLCCHLQGDAGCVAAGILMGWEACAGGLRAPPAPPWLWQPLRLFYFGEWEPPGLAGGGKEGVEGTGTSFHTLESGSVTLFLQFP